MRNSSELSSGAPPVGQCTIKEFSEQTRPSTPDSACGSEQDWTGLSSASSSSSSSSSQGNIQRFTFFKHSYENQELHKFCLNSTFSRKPRRNRRSLKIKCPPPSFPQCQENKSGRCLAESDVDSGIFSVSPQSSCVSCRRSANTATVDEKYNTSCSSKPVHADESFSFSEQDIRRSCRKIFATLYAQRDMARNGMTAFEKPTISYSDRLADVHWHAGCTHKCDKFKNNLALKPFPRNHSCDSLPNSRSMVVRDRKKIHRLSLQHSPCEAEDMLRVYARPVSVIPDDVHVDQEEFRFKDWDPKLQGLSICLDDRTRVFGRSNMSGLKFEQYEQSTNGGNFGRTRTTANVSTSSSSGTDQHYAARAIEGGEIGGSVVPFTSREPEESISANTTHKTQRRNVFRNSSVVKSQTCLNMAGKSESQNRMHKSDLALYKSQNNSWSDSTHSWSKRTLVERMQDIGRTARATLRRAFSAERIYRPQKNEMRDEAAQAKTSHEASGEKELHQKTRGRLVKGIKLRMSRRRTKEKKISSQLDLQTARVESTRSCVWDYLESSEDGPMPENTWGQLLQLNVDGSQVIELRRVSGKPFGFFVARGRVKDTKGIFVSRMQDETTRRQLAGLLDVGDEILEVEAVDVRAADITEVNMLMSKKTSLLLTVLPYICRKDI